MTRSLRLTVEKNSEGEVRWGNVGIVDYFDRIDGREWGGQGNSLFTRKTFSFPLSGNGLISLYSFQKLESHRYSSEWLFCTCFTGWSTMNSSFLLQLLSKHTFLPNTRLIWSIPLPLGRRVSLSFQFSEAADSQSHPVPQSYVSWNGKGRKSSWDLGFSLLWRLHLFSLVTPSPSFAGQKLYTLNTHYI